MIFSKLLKFINCNQFKYDGLVAQALTTLFLILLHYCFSIGITFYQKKFIKVFHFPLLVVSCHMVAKFFLSAIIRELYTYLTDVSRVSLNFSTHGKRLALVGIASALDIGLSNWSFEFITVSLYTMTKSTGIIFILAFAMLFGLEKKRISVISVVFLIAFGLFMFTYHSTQFQLEGFLMVIGASFLSGLRWTMTQLLMQRKENGLSNPIDMIYHVQPWMILVLLPLTIWFEGIPLLFGQVKLHLNWINLTSIIIGSFIAFLMEISEYLLLVYTSSLTMAIAGVLKETLTVFLAVEYDGDKMNFINFIGLVICLQGIITHVVLKTAEVSKERPKLENPDELEVSISLLVDDQ